MKKTMMYASIGASIVLILASLSSVIGFTTSESNNQDIESPLFAVRTARSTHVQTRSVLRNEYLGKGKNLNLFFSSQSAVQIQLEKAMTLIRTNPLLIKEFFKKLSDSPQVIQFLQEYGVSVSDVEQYIYQMQDHPELLTNQMTHLSHVLLPTDGPRPLRFVDTSQGRPMCNLIFLLCLPLGFVLGLILSTITLVTCLNIGGCGEAIINIMITLVVQGLTQP